MIANRFISHDTDPANTPDFGQTGKIIARYWLFEELHIAIFDRITQPDRILDAILFVRIHAQIHRLANGGANRLDALNISINITADFDFQRLKSSLGPPRRIKRGIFCWQLANPAIKGNMI